MTQIVRDSSCEAYTRELGTSLAHVLRGGDAITLSGGLGAGKTTLTRSIVAGLGVNPQVVSSPTFVVINQYDVPPAAVGTSRAGIRRVAHVDAYRMEAGHELETLGWDRYFEGSAPLQDVLGIVEWPEKLGQDRPSPAMEITIETLGPTSRHMTIQIPEAWMDRPGMQTLIEREPARCRVTGKWIPPTHPTYPFFDDRARDADLHRWFSGQYRISREATNDDIESGE